MIRIPFQYPDCLPSSTLMWHSTVIVLFRDLGFKISLNHGYLIDCPTVKTRAQKLSIQRWMFVKVQGLFHPQFMSDPHHVSSGDLS
jgi:hypothetical protein